MNIDGAISAVDALKPNTYDRTQKIKWLSTIDWLIVREIYAGYTDIEYEYDGYTEDTDGDTELLACEPYSEMYVSYLAAQIDYANNETALYNNDITAFNDYYEQYHNYINRTYTHKQVAATYF